jgi:hypothetical protein
MKGKGRKIYMLADNDFIRLKEEFIKNPQLYPDYYQPYYYGPLRT